MSGYVYKDVRQGANANPLPNGWEELLYVAAGGFDSFGGGAYRNLQTGEIVIAYEGTYFGSLTNPQVLGDLIADAGLIPGPGSSQILSAVTLYQIIKGAFPSASISFTGHSLGGGLASMMSVWFDRPALVFDEIGVEGSALNPSWALLAKAHLSALGYSDPAFNSYLLNVTPFGPFGSLTSFYRGRESRVTDIYVKGEVATPSRTVGAAIVGTELEVVATGHEQVPATDLHSINLAIAILARVGLKEALDTQPNLLRILFDKSLRATDPNTSSLDVVSAMVNDHVAKGVESRSSLLATFSRDLIKLPLASNASSRALLEAAQRLGVEYYWQLADLAASSRDELFTRVSGGISFDLAKFPVGIGAIKPYSTLKDSVLGLAAPEQDSELSAAIEAFIADKKRWTVSLGSSTIASQTIDQVQDVMLGGAEGDTLSGGGGNDLLIGLSGADTLDGGAGEDKLFGGRGVDFLKSGADADLLVGGEGDDALLDGGDGNDEIYGDGKSEDFTAYSGDDTLRGGKGNDKLLGGAGADKLYGEDDADTIKGGKGEDLIVGGKGADTLLDGGHDSDRIYGDEEDPNAPTGNADTIRGGAGDDKIYAGGGADVSVDGEAGKDLVVGGFGADVLHSGGDDDEVYGGLQNIDDSQDGSDDQLFGDGGNDKLYGGAGRDVLIGGAGDDELRGGKGVGDYVVGGAGFDTYFYRVDDGADLIFDEDGDGKVLYEGLQLNGGANRTKGALVWYDGDPCDADFTYSAASDPNAGPVTLTITSKAGGQLKVFDFDNGELGINLSDGNDPNCGKRPPTPARSGPPTRGDPLVLDLGSSGIATYGLSANLYFDLDGDGFAEKTGWAGPQEGVLVYDRSADGILNDGQELFGDFTRLSGGQLATGGFQALSAFDTNRDALIDAQDPVWSSLRVGVWETDPFDQLILGDPRDAVSLKGLEALGITSISVASTIVSGAPIDPSVNVETRTGTYTLEGGATRQVAEFRLARDNAQTKFLHNLPLPEANATDPSLALGGQVMNLQQALIRDDTGEYLGRPAGTLRAKLDAFRNESDPAQWFARFEELLFAWTGADAIPAGLRTGPFDARHAAVLEKSYGQSFQNPNADQWAAWQTAYEQLCEAMYSGLLAETHLETQYDAIDWAQSSVTQSLIGDLSAAQAMLDSELAGDPVRGRALVNEFARSLRGLGHTQDTTYLALREHFTGGGTDRAREYEFDASYGIVGPNAPADAVVAWNSAFTERFYQTNPGNPYGNGGDDVIYVDAPAGTQSHLVGTTGNNVLVAGAGNDLLWAHEGEDLLDGGAGDDILAGGAGLTRARLHARATPSCARLHPRPAYAARLPAHGPHGARHSIHDGQYALRAGVEHPSSRSRPHAVPDPLKERHTQLRFERVHTHRHGRRGQTKECRCTREAIRIGCCEERSQIAQGHPRGIVLHPRHGKENSSRRGWPAQSIAEAS